LAFTVALVVAVTVPPTELTLMGDRLARFWALVWTTP